MEEWESGPVSGWLGGMEPGFSEVGDFGSPIPSWRRSSRNSVISAFCLLSFGEGLKVGRRPCSLLFVCGGAPVRGGECEGDEV